MVSAPTYYATGKRKTSIARVFMRPGAGKITVNDKDIGEYFSRETAKMVIYQPLELTKTLDKFDISVNVAGGGITGQAGAVKHGISKALLQVGPDMRTPLRRQGFLTRDPRAKERKKYGRKRARRGFQFSKR